MAINAKVVNYLRDFGILAVLVLLVAFFMVISPDGFAQPGNLINVVRQASINGIIAVGMMFVIISGGIDLSAGSTVALSGVVAALAAKASGLPLIAVVVVALAAGAAVGLVNGVGVAYLGLPAFIITLATMTGVRGLALIISGGSPVFGLPPEFENIASSAVAVVVPILVVYFVTVMLGSGFVLTRTTFGRRVYAIGGNPEAATVSGIRTKRYLLGVYTLAGTLAGFAGLLVASRTMQGSPTAGQGYELDAIAAVVIGGISMSGGAGKWYGAMIGALLIAVMSSGLDILGVNSNYQAIIKGAIIAVAVYFDLRSKKLITV
ncbi:MAG: ABC transporter permease [Propionibacteriaceae bacterium]|nr:ABC transporter permease [Propionibacteriaceae bacterium]